jgi:hypothetical protein
MTSYTDQIVALEELFVKVKDEQAYIAEVWGVREVSPRSHPSSSRLDPVAWSHLTEGREDIEGHLSHASTCHAGPNDIGRASCYKFDKKTKL